MSPTMPFQRPPGCPFDPPAELAERHAEAPLSRLSYPDGHEGWLATGHDTVRTVLADPTLFSSRAELTHFAYPLPGVDWSALPTEKPPMPVGVFGAIDPPEHTRYRRAVIGKFTVRRIRQLVDRIEEIATEHLDAMAAQGPGVDLVAAYALPIAALTVCELLGVPYADRAYFLGLNAEVTDVNGGMEKQLKAYGAIQKYVVELAVAKRAAPTDDLLSDLGTLDFTDEEVGGLGAFLLSGGMESVINMLAMSVFALLEHPDQLAVLRAEPDLVDNAVEELLRYLTVGHTGSRTALADTELAGQQIKAGETITLAMQAANRDPARFADPDRLDVRRDTAGHLTFGHGIHQCVGQHLARVQLQIGLRSLLTRFPTLRLAIPADQVQTRGEFVVYGPVRLPVAWD